MGSLGFWTIAVILYQTIFCIIISWLTLDCQFTPKASELHEVTLVKMLYLYDPEACGRVYFYNYTNGPSSTIVWPIKNEIAAAFRVKIRVWLSLHSLWLLLGCLYFTQRQRPCGFYAVLLPFTLIGVALLITDLVYMTLFLMDTQGSMTEADILQYVDSNKQHLQTLKKKQSQVIMSNIDSVSPDTSWVSLLLAYASCRGIIQWFINFWLVKDNYFEGLSQYRKLQSQENRKIYSQ
ncbi:uncharacterized protein LOC113514072 [Galleria mellonella]|uniref:Uncharacterized protein LOC113514072 n=1 Tax=Galleria mellonella TaxID=7137 RepID=A0A6J3BZ20_GALME|nr:uncharacterized protein LOC113514072 [Galleria mellonella]